MSKDSIELAATEWVVLKLRHRDGRTSWHEVPAAETAVDGLVITAYYDLGPHGALLERPGRFALAHRPTGRFLPLRGEITHPRVLRFMADRLVELGWRNWSWWTCPDEIPEEIPTVVAAVQREAEIAVQRGQL